MKRRCVRFVVAAILLAVLLEGCGQRNLCEGAWLHAVDTDTSDETGKTDMTDAIMEILEETGYCHLGEGIFYVGGEIDMPEGATLEGCGKKTEIRLLSSVESGCCVKLGKYNTVKNICFSGGREPPDISSSGIGERNGVCFIANKDGKSAQLPEVMPCIVSECWFENFSGSAIVGHNSGGATRETLLVSDCYIQYCAAGINIDYYCEYGKYTNVVIDRCHYACINNGGNNTFFNCTFHGTVGFLMDNSSGDKKNDSHGSMVGCIVNHADSWNRPETLGGGDAVRVVGQQNGFIFTGCQFWYGFIRIENSRGMAFSDCLFGDAIQNPHITVTGDFPAFFSDCIFHQSPVLDLNTSTVFTDCVLDTDGTAVGR